MKKLALALSLAFGTTAFAEVPALINYQGRLVNGVGNPVTGSKEFKLDIYDSQTEGTLIYQETLADITLDEDGAYSFQFGSGESRTETSEIIATGDGEAQLFQVPLENTPLGPISVTDGTTTFTQGQEQTGEEAFTFLYVRGPNRINLVCNEPPAAGVSFTATYRYNEAGIVGALGTAAEHWMEVTIGGEKQEPRQRLVAVPFALKAGGLIGDDRTRETKLDKCRIEYPRSSGVSYVSILSDKLLKIFDTPQSASKLKGVSIVTVSPIRLRVVEFDYSQPQSERITEIVSIDLPINPDRAAREVPLNLALTKSPSTVHFIELSDSSSWTMNAPLILEYEE
ncbi:DUF4815 domain-containing protein [Akkermansiaceae bacterium]|nr:DUF4815 domain-containing protein [Akkermansiaceae bacterium]